MRKKHTHSRQRNHSRRRRRETSNNTDNLKVWNGPDAYDCDHFHRVDYYNYSDYHSVWNGWCRVPWFREMRSCGDGIHFHSRDSTYCYYCQYYQERVRFGGSGDRSSCYFGGGYVEWVCTLSSNQYYSQSETQIGTEVSETHYWHCSVLQGASFPNHYKSKFA